MYVHEQGDWPYGEIPDEIVPPAKGTMIGEVETYGDSKAYFIIFEYSGLSEDDVMEYIQSYVNKGWDEGDDSIDKVIYWNGNKYTAFLSYMFDGNNVVFDCNLILTE